MSATPTSPEKRPREEDDATTSAGEPEAKRSKPNENGNGSDRKTILVVNDDSYSAPGINALVRKLVADDKYDVCVVAPQTEQSGVSHGITIFGSIDCKAVDLSECFEYEGASSVPAYAVGGTPADCVKVSDYLFPDKNFDLVVSGINKGCNVGTGVHASGTCGAAREAAIEGKVAMATSLFVSHRVPASLDLFDTAAHEVTRIIDLTLERGIPPQTWLNVNVPGVEEVKGHKWTVCGGTGFDDRYEEVPNDQDGVTSFVLKGKIRDFSDSSGRDDGIELQKGYVTVSLQSVYIKSDREVLPTWDELS